jgi:RHS repeat-associated protein
MQGNQLYGPYGNQRLKQGSLSTNKGFTGQYNDGLTGLDYYNARYYDPAIGLFLSADPMGGLDAYGYAGGNPETDTDPSGLYRIAATGPGGSPSANAYPTTIPTVVSLFPPEPPPYHWQPASSFPSRPQPVAPSFQPDQCRQIGCAFHALAEVGTVHAVHSTTHITGTTVTCSIGCFVNPFSTSVSTTSYYRSSTAVPLVICTAGFDCYDNGGGDGGGEESGKSEVMNSADGGLPPAPDDGVGAVDPEEPNGGTMTGETTKDLYRGGNASGPRIDNLRPPASDGTLRELDPDGNVQPGMGPSTFEEPLGRGKWWQLPAGTEIPEGIQIINDNGTHWVISPTETMMGSEFASILLEIKGWRLV